MADAHSARKTLHSAIQTAIVFLDANVLAPLEASAAETKNSDDDTACIAAVKSSGNTAAHDTVVQMVARLYAAQTGLSASLKADVREKLEDADESDPLEGDEEGGGDVELGTGSSGGDTAQLAGFGAFMEAANGLLQLVTHGVEKALADFTEATDSACQSTTSVLSVMLPTAGQYEAQHGLGPPPSMPAPAQAIFEAYSVRLAGSESDDFQNGFADLTLLAPDKLQSSYASLLQGPGGRRFQRSRVYGPRDWI